MAPFEHNANAAAQVPGCRADNAIVFCACAAARLRCVRCVGTRVALAPAAQRVPLAAVVHLQQLPRVLPAVLGVRPRGGARAVPVGARVPVPAQRPAVAQPVLRASPFALQLLALIPARRRPTLGSPWPRDQVIMVPSGGPASSRGVRTGTGCGRGARRAALGRGRAASASAAAGTRSWCRCACARRPRP